MSDFDYVDEILAKGRTLFVLDAARAEGTDAVAHGYLMHAFDGRGLLAKARTAAQKAEAKKQAEAAGYKSGDERWVTVHPWGTEGKGVPVLIQLRKDGSWSVIGGAGGKLNHLRLTGIKSEEEYARARAKRREREHRRKEMLSEVERRAEEGREEAGDEGYGEAAVELCPRPSELGFERLGEDSEGVVGHSD